MAGLWQLLWGGVSGWVRGFLAAAMIAMPIAILAALTSAFGLTAESLPVLLLFTAWLLGTYIALRLIVRSLRRRQSSRNGTLLERRTGQAPDHIPYVEPLQPKLGVSLGERARNLVPWALTLLATLPLAVLALLVGAVVADTLEAAGVPDSVTFPVGLVVAGAVLVVCTAIVFRRLWSRSPVARQRRSMAEARELRLRDIDARLAAPSTPPPGVPER